MTATATLATRQWHPEQHVRVRDGWDGYDAKIIAANQICACVERDGDGAYIMVDCVYLARKPGRPRKVNNVFAFPGARRQAQATTDNTAPAAQVAQTPVREFGDNVAVRMNGKYLEIRMDLTARGHPSESGKSTVIGTTHGNREFGNLVSPGVRLAVNVYVPKQHR